LIKNSIDHGIEPSVERILKNKQPIGSLCFNSYINNFNLYIDYHDDGLGYKEEDFQNNTISQVKSASLISGRKIGATIIQSLIHELNGKQKIIFDDSNQTVLKISIPLDVFSIPCFPFFYQNELYLIPTNQIDKVEGDKAHFKDSSLAPIHFTSAYLSQECLIKKTYLFLDKKIDSFFVSGISILQDGVAAYFLESKKPESK
jgi:two-component system chemotaxis sensor kinase CheA